jgi:hypothetical protein
MIDKVHINSLPNSDFSKFMNEALGIVANNDPAALKVQKQEEKLRKIVTQADSMFKIKEELKDTENLALLDLRRDRAITGIIMYVNALTNHFDESTVRSAEKLSHHLQDCGGEAIARENYASETTSIRKLLKDRETKPVLKTAVAALKLEDWAKALEAYNNAFDDQHQARSGEVSAASPDAIRTKRLEAITAYYELCEHIAAYYVVKKGAEPFSKTVKELNVLIKRYNNLPAG